MNKHVNDRMVIWSEWVIRKDDGNLGYPKECPYTRRIARSGGMGYQPNFNDDSIEIDRCLAKIKKDHPIIFRALHLFYGIDFKSGKAISIMLTKEMIAKDLQCHRDTVYSYLERGHILLLDALHENDVIAHLR